MPMISSRGRTLLAALTVMGGVLLAQQASASCRIQNSWFVAQDVTMDMGQIVILPSTPVGGVIKISEPINQQNSVARCDRSGGRSIGEYVNAAQKRPVAGFSNVYETDVAGVGIRLYRDSGAIQTYYPHTINFASNSTISLVGGTFRIQLIKTAAQTGSGVIAPNGRFTTYYFDGDGAGRPVLTSTFGLGHHRGQPDLRSAGRQPQHRRRLRQRAQHHLHRCRFQGRRPRFRDPAELPGQQCRRLPEQDRHPPRCRPGQLEHAGRAESARLPTARPASASRWSSAMAPPSAKCASADHQRRHHGAGHQRHGAAAARARYVQTQAGTVGAGVANGQATFTIQYE